MNLHYSQTCLSTFFSSCSSYTSMNLHYSQTECVLHEKPFGLIPLWIYITLKPALQWPRNPYRLIPLWIYITLKRYYNKVKGGLCLIPLWIYITLKPWNVKKGVHHGLIPLWIYITLKPSSEVVQIFCGLIPLWIYITLKLPLCVRQWSAVLYLYEFTLLSNQSIHSYSSTRSYTSMNLHYSQTTAHFILIVFLSYTSMNLHYSQTM